MRDSSVADHGEPVVVGIGSALVDILLRETDDFLARTGAEKGGMVLVDAGRIREILSGSSREPSIMPGGSACNTIIGIGKLGQPARFIGKRGDDDIGREFEKALGENHVEPCLDVSPTETGRVLSVITPDAQRSMFTFLGASAETQPGDITREKLTDAALVHIEGYLLFNRDLMLSALETAKQAGALVSLDLASFTVVEAARDTLSHIVRDYVDILLANEDEARAYTGCSDESESLKMLSKDVETAVLKVGKRGSFINHKGTIHSIGIKGTGEALDTTGAGDLWGAGFLYGLVRGMPIEKCGELGSACGYEVCRVVGAHIPESGWARILRLLT